MILVSALITLLFYAGVYKIKTINQLHVWLKLYIFCQIKYFPEFVLWFWRSVFFFLCLVELLQRFTFGGWNLHKLLTDCFKKLGHSKKVTGSSPVVSLCLCLEGKKSQTWGLWALNVFSFDLRLYSLPHFCENVTFLLQNVFFCRSCWDIWSILSFSWLVLL